MKGAATAGSPWLNIMAEGGTGISALFSIVVLAGGFAMGVAQKEVGAVLHEQILRSQSLQTGGCVWRGPGTDSVTVGAPGTGRSGFDNAKARPRRGSRWMAVGILRSPSYLWLPCPSQSRQR